MRFGLHYSLQSPTQEWAPLYQQCLQQLVYAEKLGFDCAVFAEHHFLQDGWIPVPNLMCAAAAGVTSRIRLGTDILILPLMHPLRVAEEAAFVDALSQGRFILGVGLGVFPKEFESYEIPIKQRASRAEESIQIIRRLLTEEKVSHVGRYFHFKDVTITPKPLQKRLPIWIAGIEEPAIKRAARLGDAWIPSQIAPFDLLKKQFRVYQKTLEENGREFLKIERPLRKEAYLAENSDQAWEEVKKAILHEYGEVYYKESRIQAEDGHFIKPGEVSFEDALKLLRSRFIIGGPDEFIAEVEKYQRELGVDLLLMRVHLPGLEHWKVTKSLELIGKKIMPYFADQDRK
jgi:probable F420-dependent oxidoreductase